MPHLLIVEDDELLRDGLASLLAQAGHSAVSAADGEAALALLESSRFDGVILDLGLPRISGMAVLQWIRQRLNALPVLILTARDGVEDRVLGLNAGADDYLTKPFSIDELAARLSAMLRRARLPAFGGTLELPAGAAGQLRIDAQRPLAWLHGEPLELTQREWALLTLLVSHAGQVVSRDAVLGVWQSEPPEGSAAGSNALEVYVHRLRRKLAGSSLNIRNVRGLGYLLEAPAE